MIFSHVFSQVPKRIVLDRMETFLEASFCISPHMINNSSSEILFEPFGKFFK